MTAIVDDSVDIDVMDLCI